MLKLTVEIEGKTTEDMDDALREVKRLVNDGYTSGANKNDTGSFTFAVTGEEEPVETEA